MAFVDKPKQKRGSNKYCCVVGCTNNQLNSLGSMKFYTFPTKNPLYPHKAQRRQEWLRRIKRKNLDGSDWEPYPRSLVCSSHFVNNKKSEDPRSPSYHPSIFPEYGSGKMNGKLAHVRCERLTKRYQNKERVAVSRDEEENQMPAFEEVNLSNVQMAEVDLYDFEEVVTSKDAECQFTTYDSLPPETVLICNRWITNYTCDAQIQTDIGGIDFIKKEPHF